MALNPFQTEDARFEEITTITQPLKTYRLNHGAERIDRLIDDEEAVKQHVSKTMDTARFRFSIYDDQYGCEISTMLGRDVTQAFLDAELPRLIREALIYDERISDVTQFEVSREGDKVFVQFTVVLSGDTEVLISEEVAI